MTLLFTIVAIWLLFMFSYLETKNFTSFIVLKFPFMLFAGIFAILAAKGWGVL